MPPLNSFAPLPEPDRICFNKSVDLLYTRNAQAIGIGSARSGSSAIAAVMKELAMEHAGISVSVGRASLLGHKCCDLGELNFFNVDKHFARGLREGYDPAFQGDIGKATVLFSKTPRYSSHPLVPFRILRSLGRCSTKLVKTYREPAAALYSIYRLHYRNVQHCFGSPTTFREFAEKSAEGLQMYTDCRRNAAEAWERVEMKRRPPLTSEDPFSALQAFEEFTWQRCYAWHGRSLYVANLMPEFALDPWIQVFGEDRILCVDMQHAKADGKLLRANVQSFLEGNASGAWQTPKFIDPTDTLVADRVDSHFNDTREEVLEALAWLRSTVFLGIYKQFYKTCSALKYSI